MNDNPVVVTLYRWAGQWGPFKVNIPCGECALTVDVLKDTFANELAGIPIELEDREWLTNWYKPLLKGGWHAPIVMVDGNIVSQGNALNRGVLPNPATRQPHIWQGHLPALCASQRLSRAGGHQL